ncbi:LysR family transcriptional regulator [Pectinatus sottacetonis]|uniref:LysR family transcriptional regulator n=1 Tax=Pectinatus sottacetonis TaxID=1002795 RepID=UPI0018C6D634|nr:LysR family transcriptional regulator [Pectinatus sottacetonis]
MFKNKEYIYAVYIEQSFSKAAKRLYVSQPCLSAMVKKVETKIGVPIFNRNTSPVQLTKVGSAYINYIEKIMQYEHEFETYLTDIRGLKSGEISIGACNIISSFILPKIVTQFSKIHPLIKVNLYEGNIDSLNEKLHKGTLDVILDNYPIDESVYFTVPLFYESLYVVISQPLCKKIEDQYLSRSMTSRQVLSKTTDKKSNKSVPFSIFHNIPFIILRKGNDTRIRYDQLCMDFNIQPPIILEVDQLSTAYNICSNELSATLVVTH